MKRFLKRFAVALLTLVVLTLPVVAQQPEEQVSVPKSLLSKDQLDALAAKNLEEKMTKYGKWVGIGHEVGTAVNESLSAVTTQANNFAQTPVGKWTMFIVIWKVIGHDAMGFVLGILTIVVGLPIWIWSYRKYLPHRIVTERVYDNSNKWFRRVASEKYQVVMTESNDAANWYRAFHFIFLAVLFGLSMWVMFS